MATIRARLAATTARWVVTWAGLAITGFIPRTTLAQQAPTRPAEVTDSAVARGAQVFRGSANCVACHGARGEGTTDGPSLADGVWLRGRGTYRELLEQVVHGTSRKESATGVPMPMRGWSGINDDDVRAVAAFVWALSRGAAPAP